jgi:ABC-type enterobactin transport system permease subunit
MFTVPSLLASPVALAALAEPQLVAKIDRSKILTAQSLLKSELLLVLADVIKRMQLPIIAKEIIATMIFWFSLNFGMSLFLKTILCYV